MFIGKNTEVSNDEVFDMTINNIIDFTPNMATRYQIRAHKQIDLKHRKTTRLWQLNKILPQECK